MDVSETSRLTLVAVRDGVRTEPDLPLIAPFGIESKAIPQIDYLRMQPVRSEERRIEGNRIVRARARRTLCPARRKNGAAVQHRVLKESETSF